MEITENKDFIKRTRQIVCTYKGEFELTLLLNACIGLLFVAKEKYGNILSKSVQNLKSWGIDVDDIKICKHLSKSKIIVDEKKTVYAVCKHIRNSIAHCNFRFKNADRKIVGIILYDFVTQEQIKTKTFELSISIPDFKRFVLSVSDYILQKAEQK